MEETTIATAQAVPRTKTKSSRLWGRTPLDLPLALFLISALIGLWVAYDQSLSWPLLGTLLGSLALYGLITWPDWGKRPLRQLAWLLLLAQGALALYFITQYTHLGYPAKMSFVNRLGRLTGGIFPAWGNFFPHPNAVATFIEGGLPLAIGLWWSARDRRGRGAASLLFGLLGYALLLTASRGAWAALVAGLGLAALIWLGRRLSRRWRLSALAILAGVALTAGVALVVIGPERVPGLASVQARGVDRYVLYRNSLHLIGDYPLLGIGLGDTFALVYSRYVLLIPHAYLTYAHNLPLAIWLNQGLLGVISFGWMLLAFYWIVVKQIKHRQASPLFWAAVLGVTTMLFHGVTDAPQYADSRWIMPAFFGLLGLSVATAPPPRRTRPRVPKTAYRLGLITLILIVAGAIFLLRDTFYANLGAIQQARADLAPGLDDVGRRAALDQATNHYRRALEIDPQQPVAHWRLGLIDLEADRFPQAIEHLEVARTTLPGHRGVRKALGYAHLWNGEIDQAYKLLNTLKEIPEELSTWSWWRGEHGQAKLADYAQQLASRLSGE